MDDQLKRQGVRRARTDGEMAEARTMLRPFVRAGFRFILLSSTAKVPIEKGWQEIDYSKKLRPWLARGGNVGVLLAEDDLVLDVDPRNRGLQSFDRLQVDLNIDLGGCPAVLSGRGDGGRHIYMKKPVGVRVRNGLDGYPGLDIKSKGGFVLAPSSRHPDTGGIYRPDPSTPSIEAIGQAPAPLLDAFRRPDGQPRVHSGGGELTVDELKVVLSALDPAEYGQGNYAGWIRLAAACHDATNGDGLEVWLDWAAQDDAYATEADHDRNVATWESFKAGKAGGANYLTLLWEVARAGRPDISRRLEPGLRFELSAPIAEHLNLYTFDKEDF